MVSPIPTMAGSVSVAPRRSSHFYFLDGLRGLASIWVVFFHVGAASVPALAAAMPRPMQVLLFDQGALGVAIFFVLSGFVISYSLRQVILDRNYFANFTLRRWVRLSPPYYVSIVVVIGIDLLASWVKGKPLLLPTGGELAGHLLYLQDVLGLGHISDVYWTLCLEMQFYLLFCGLLWLAQRANRSIDHGDAKTLEQCHQHASRFFFWIGGLVAVIPPLFLDAAVRPVWFVHQVYAFWLGAFAYWCWAQRLSKSLFYGYSAVILAGGLIHQNYFAMTAVVTAVGLLNIAQLQYLSRWFADPVMQFLGCVSYSLYLIHVPVVGGVIFLGRKALGTGVWADSLLLGAALSLSLVAATLLWKIAESPAIAWSRRLKLQPARD